eukprot:TRINITY_DN770_c0_g1_i2.p1 TRINITY_DN770_c0_g1~~TRINITY_DN770_c0_g1_i2.p1  ORF type:complete len:881 (+),score=228.74 TRINITY_DN770_c0_g1_i2:221-2863(+)
MDMPIEVLGRRAAVVAAEVPKECKDTLEFEGASTVAQIFQGVAFLSLAIFLIFVNNAKVGVGSKAPLEVRYQTAITISTAVCLFSGFFNILQMTGLDDFDLPRSTSFTLDLSRPVEWLMTCPVLQLVLVILGGTRIPSYRKFMMPLLCAANLLCGVAAMFSEEGAMQWTWFVFSCVIWMIYTYYNMQQIVENSDGDENIFHGQSDYRMLSVICIATWFPFPFWFVVSPEGVGLVSDVTTIQLGWSVLNVTAKFGFILHLQYIKSKYCKTLDATRELYGVNGAPADAAALKKAEALHDGDGEDFMSDNGGEQKMRTLISETMVSLNMSSHTDRFMKLMLDNGIVSTDILERLTADRASDLNLPWSLCDAVQKRWRAEKMNLGQDNGGTYEKEDPFKKLLAEGKARRQGHPHQVMPEFFQNAGIPGTLTPPVAGNVQMIPAVDNERMDSLEANLNGVMQQLESMFGVMQTIATKVEHFDSAQEAICQRLDFAQQAQLQTLNSSQVLLHKIDSSQEDISRKVAATKDAMEQLGSKQEQMLETITGSKESTKNELLDSVANSGKALLQKLDSSQQTLLQRQGDAHELLVRVNQSQESMVQKLETSSEAASRRSMQTEALISTKLEEVAANVAKSCNDAVGKVSKSTHGDLEAVKGHCAATSEVLERGLVAQEERMADVRRQNMMIMDMLTGTQERVMQSADNIADFARRDLSMQDPSAKLEVTLRGILNCEIGRLEASIQDMMMSSGHAQGHAQGGEETAQLGSAADRLEAAAMRLEAGNSTFGSGVDDKIEEVIRREIAAVAMALAQQHREMAEQQVDQVREVIGEKVQGELRQTTEQLQSKVESFEGNLDKSMDRFEQGVDKILAVSGGVEKESRRRPVERG